MHGTESTPAWKVLLIGGNSGAGKTTVAAHVARGFGAALSQVDDFRLVLQRLTTPDQQPRLHFFLDTPGVWQLEPETLCEGLKRVGEVVSAALEIVIAHHVATSLPIVLEGDGILPALAAQRSFAGVDAGGQVRALFVIETDQAALLANLVERGRGFERCSERGQRGQVEMSRLYGEWLVQEARRCALPVLRPRPRETLVARALALLG